jgi:hypothetical protein
MAVASKVADRLSSGLKQFQPVLQSAKTRDVNESDTSMIVTDMLALMFGYDKYNEVTREHSIRGTFCDLATKIDGKIRILIEVKAINVDLKDQHVKQAVDYAANQGVDWVCLTNGAIWRVYRVTFGKPINSELVIEMDLLLLNSKNSQDIENLYLLTRESIVKSGLDAYHDHKEATSRFFLGALILSDPVLDIVRRELRRVSPDVRIGPDDLRDILTLEVLKRDVIEGEKADAARRKVAKAAAKSLRTRKDTDAGITDPPTKVPDGSVTE